MFQIVCDYEEVLEEVQAGQVGEEGMCACETGLLLGVEVLEKY